MEAETTGPPPMTGRLIAAVLRQAEALAAADARGCPDADLVRRFLRGDEAAFAALLRRHGPMVWGTCKNLLPAEADAEDAFQATFLALVRGAGRVRDPAAVGAWLHGVAVRVAQKVRRSAARRKGREQAAAVPEAPPDRDTEAHEWAELHAAVHDEVARLPARERVVFVLCGLEGARQPDAAARLGLKVNTVSGLLARARKRLLDRLARRGLAPAVAAAGAGVGTTAPAAAPDSLIDSVLSLLHGPAGAPAAVLELARGATEGSMTGKKLLAAAVLVAGALGAGTGAAVLSSAGAQSPAGGIPGGRGTTGAPGMPGGVSMPAGGSMMAGMMGGPGMASAPAGTQWEYKRINVAVSGWDEKLAKDGENGWEAVCVVGSSAQWAGELLLKRRKQPAAAGGMPGMGMPGMGPGIPGGPGMMGPGGRPGAGTPGGGLPPGEQVAIVYKLTHLQVADLTPEIRKQFDIIAVYEPSNTVSISAAAKDPKLSQTLLSQFDAAAGKAKKE